MLHLLPLAKSVEAWISFVRCFDCLVLLLHGRRVGSVVCITCCTQPDICLGGYAFITNMLPLHCFALLIMGRFSSRIYVAYSTYYAIGTLASMNVPFVGFQPIRTSEHMSALGVFGLLQLVAFVQLVRTHLPRKQFRYVLSV